MEYVDDVVDDSNDDDWFDDDDGDDDDDDIEHLTFKAIVLTQTKGQAGHPINLTKYLYNWTLLGNWENEAKTVLRF